MGFFYFRVKLLICVFIVIWFLWLLIGILNFVEENCFVVDMGVISKFFCSLFYFNLYFIVKLFLIVWSCEFKSIVCEIIEVI